jgi:hypothetical protein
MTVADSHVVLLTGQHTHQLQKRADGAQG